MNRNRPLNILVLPELFPKFDGDTSGVFILDYLESTHHLVKNNTLYIKLQGDKRGVFNDSFFKKFNIKRVIITRKHFHKLLKPFLYIFWFIKGYNIGKKYTNTDLIHVHGAILNGTLACFLSKKLKIPFIVSEHLGPYSRVLDNWFLKKISTFVLNRASKVLAVSQYQKNEILKLGIPSSKIEVSYNPVNTQLFSPKQPQRDSKNIVFISRLDEFKGGLRTVKAFHKISKNYPDYKLIIAGEGEEKNTIRNYIDSNHLQKKIIQKKTLTKIEMVNLFHQSCFLVFPSRFETFGLVAAEALSCGLPIICTNKTAPKEFINAQNGVLVEPDNINDIANAIENLILNKKNYHPLRIHQEIKTKFGLNNFGKYLLNTYNKLT